MKAIPLPRPGKLWFGIPNPLQIGDGVVTSKRTVVMLMSFSDRPRLLQPFQYPRFLELRSSTGGLITDNLYLTCPDSNRPQLCLWLSLPFMRSLFARLFTKAVGSTEILVLIHKNKPSHVEAQLHFAKKLIQLGHPSVLVGLASAELESRAEIASFSEQFGHWRIRNSDQLAAEHILPKWS